MEVVEDLQKQPPLYPAVMWIVNVPERKTRQNKKISVIDCSLQFTDINLTKQSNSDAMTAINDIIDDFPGFICSKPSR